MAREIVRIKDVWTDASNWYARDKQSGKYPSAGDKLQKWYEFEVSNNMQEDSIYQQNVRRAYQGFLATDVMLALEEALNALGYMDINDIIAKGKEFEAERIAQWEQRKKWEQIQKRDKE